MTMTTAPNVDAMGSVSPSTSSQLQMPVMSGSLQIRAPSAESSLDEPRSPRDMSHSDRSGDDEPELSPQSGPRRDPRDGAGSEADHNSDGGGPITSPTLDAGVKRGAWSPQEDEQLVHLVETMRPLKWVHVSSYMKTRTSKQCRERYHNYLKPTLNRAPISKDEGRKIEELVAIHGKRWAEISRQLPGRSDNAIKNWWNASVTRRRASQDTSAVQLQNNQQQQPAQPTQSSNQHLSINPQTQPQHSDDSDNISPRSSTSPPAPPPISIMFNKTYMDPASRSPVTPSSAGSQSRSGPHRTRSVANSPAVPYPSTTPRWADSRPRLSVGSISSIGSRSNSIADENGRSVSPNASPPGLPPGSRPGIPEDVQFSGFWNRRLPDYRRPSDALRSDVTSLSQYSLSTVSDSNSRRGSLNPVVPAELARPHGQPAFEQPPHHLQQPPPLQQVLQTPLVQLQPAANAIQAQNTFLSNPQTSTDTPRQESPQQGVQPDTHHVHTLEQKQAPLFSVRTQADPEQPERPPQPQNNRSSLARLSIANLTNPMPE